MSDSRYSPATTTWLEQAMLVDLGRLVVDEISDRLQCGNCGRYRDLERTAEDTIVCRACGATRGLTRIQPDTRVDMRAEPS